LHAALRRAVRTRRRGADLGLLHLRPCVASTRLELAHERLVADAHRIEHRLHLGIDRAQRRDIGVGQRRGLGQRDPLVVERAHRLDQRVARVEMSVERRLGVRGRAVAARCAVDDGQHL
jgi:hypothetical protein